MTRPMLQRVFVHGLRLEAAIGVHAHEHGRTQPLLVDVELDAELELDMGLDSTINYETVVAAAAAVLADGHLQLVETFADRLARACLDDARVRRVRVRAEKPEALAQAAGAGFELVLER
ncbi:MAG: dihydroneopterin aldolase [Proteobacteria bacterium]|nr:dihydroneopterin aldolase [Pseudomonadota bacterium]MBW3616436.1 dihydroneopterin aldolase [Pseudomonadota bacterium]